MPFFKSAIMKKSAATGRSPHHIGFARKIRLKFRVFLPKPLVMLNWLVSRLKPIQDAPGHPLGSETDISAWLSELPQVNPQRVLLALEEWLQDPEHLSRQLDTAQMARAVGRLDEYAQPAVAQCWLEVFKEARSEQRGALPTRPLENYYSHCHASSLFVFRRLVADPHLNQEKRLLAKFAARAMRAWVSLKKLAHMNYRAIPENWWGEAHELNRQAHELAISHIEQSLYRDDGLHTSLWKQYMAGLLLDTLPMSNMTANEIEAAERLTFWIEPRCQYLETQTGLSLFSIEPNGASGPQRCRNDETPTSHQPLCFFGPAAGYQQLVQLSKTFRSAGALPAWLESTGLTLDELGELLQTMIVHWSPNPPKRGQPRHASSGRINVVHGLGMVRRMIAASEFARSGRTLDYEGYLRTLRQRHHDDAVIEDVPPAPKTPMEVLQLLESAGDKQMMEQWEMLDESAHGMGVRCLTRRSWQTIGALIAYRQEHDLNWHIAIVRRLGSSHGHPNAGLATFHGTPLCSQVRVGKEPEAEGLQLQEARETSGLGWRDAIVISEEAHLVLAPSGTFKTDQRIDISIGGRFRSAIMRSMEAKGNDYELIHYMMPSA